MATDTETHRQTPVKAHRRVGKARGAKGNTAPESMGRGHRGPQRLNRKNMDGV